MTSNYAFSKKNLWSTHLKHCWNCNTLGTAMYAYPLAFSDETEQFNMQAVCGTLLEINPPVTYLYKK